MTLTERMNALRKRSRPVPDSTIIASWWWAETRGRLAWQLNTTISHIDHVWAKAKANGDLPDITRPAGGFDLRKGAMGRAA
jgi:hypothetical protein